MQKLISCLILKKPLACASLMSVSFFEAETDLLFHTKTTLGIYNFDVCLVLLQQKLVSCLIIGKTFGMHSLIISVSGFEAEADLLFNFEKTFCICANLMSVSCFEAEAGLLFNYWENVWYVQPECLLVILRQKLISFFIF